MLANKINKKILQDQGISEQSKTSQSLVDSTKYVFLDSFTTVEMAKSPRFIKSHLHCSLLPDQMRIIKPKIIYVARNPKDVCVSFFHHSCLVDGYSGSLDDYVASFVTDNGIFYFHAVMQYYHIKCILHFI